MKALTIKQPWAWAIAKGYKTIENRTWVTSYRGPLAIHAGKTWEQGVGSWMASRLREMGHPVPDRMADEMPLISSGAVIAVVELVDVCLGAPCDCGPWAIAGSKHWQIVDARPLAVPVHLKGRLGLWDVPAALLPQVTS